MKLATKDLLLERLSWRYATKQFDHTRKIPQEEWEALERALTLSPSSFGLQPWKFFVITNPEVKRRLTPASWNQPQIEQCSHLVVFAAKQSIEPGDLERYLKKIAEVRGEPLESLTEYRQMMESSLLSTSPGFEIQQWTARQAYIALGVFLSAAALLGIDACPMEGFNSEAYDKELHLLEKGYSAVVLAAAGYRAPEDKYSYAKKVRYDTQDIVQTI